MVDVHDESSRSRNMAAIRSRDTKPEMLVRQALHKMGFRYKLHDRALPGRPDLVFPKYQAVIEVHGCYWHGHDCPVGHPPASRLDYWMPKIERNRERDICNRRELEAAGWRVLTIWECALRGKGRLDPDIVLRRARDWLSSDDGWLTIEGRDPSID